jgi:hypothetical protein
VRFINTNENKVLISADSVELLQQHINCGRARTWQHLDLRILWAICFSIDDIPHIFLSDHGCFVLWEVVTIALYGLIEISTVLHDLGEVIDRELDICIGLHI